jgi:hypothetical protein
MPIDTVIRPDWSAPANVLALTTTRLSPEPAVASHGAYAEFNLASHVGDDPRQVKQNRQVLQRALKLPAEPVWLQQVHSDRAVEFQQAQAGDLEADAVYTRRGNAVCLVQTADCLPVLLCDRAGSVVATVHAGWRGLQQNIIAATIAAMGAPPASLLAWLGPAISANAYEIDESVYRRFVDENALYSSAFQDTRPGHWTLDLYAIARIQLLSLGVPAVYGGGFCTFHDAERFYSFRRDGQTGRMASMIWLNN